MFSLFAWSRLRTQLESVNILLRFSDPSFSSRHSNLWWVIQYQSLVQLDIQEVTEARPGGNLPRLSPLEGIVYNFLAKKTTSESRRKAVSKSKPHFSSLTYTYLPSMWRPKTWYCQLMQKDGESLTPSWLVWLQSTMVLWLPDIIITLINEWSIFSIGL